MSFAKNFSAQTKLLLMLGLLSGCRSERIAFQFQPTTTTDVPKAAAFTSDKALTDKLALPQTTFVGSLRAKSYRAGYSAGTRHQSIACHLSRARQAQVIGKLFLKNQRQLPIIIPADSTQKAHRVAKMKQPSVHSTGVGITILLLLALAVLAIPTGLLALIFGGIFSTLFYILAGSFLAIILVIVIVVVLANLFSPKDTKKQPITK